MADLKQALIWLGEGKKITHSKWLPDEFLTISENGYIVGEDGEPGNRDLELSTKWELYKDPKIKSLIDENLYVVWVSESQVDIGSWCECIDKFILDKPVLGSRTHYITYSPCEVEWAELPKKRSRINQNG